MRYPFKQVEEKWQKIWEEKKVYKTNLSDTEKKLYTLVMFLYPSGAKLHCGHWYNYGPTDSWARLKKLQGYNVFEPMGYDAFGLPAENYAIKTGIHPYDSTMQNIKDIREQLKRMGCMYDWEAELATCVPEYYKWNQWLFLQLYKRGLAYRKNAPVNWCPSCQTVLANEQVMSDGTCERCSSIVEQKNLTQWFFKITKYAEELLSGLDKINWPEKTKTMQRNWIGKSEGAEVIFKVDGKNVELKVFTTRPDTLWGVTYMVIAPEHPLVDEIAHPDYLGQIREYRDKIKTLTELERSSLERKKTGVPIGAYAINPVNNEKIPIWIGDYVLLTYGTGCVMAVPAHDERDFEFAKTYGLPIKKVILQDGTKEDDELKEAFIDVGTMINSGEFSGLRSDVGKLKVIEYLEKKGFGRRAINYRLKDWLISRQRYWGTPIPIIHCPKCGEVPVDEKDLPVVLPYNVDFKPKGKSPLETNEEFMNVKCPKCGADARRDPDTMDTFVDSSWYYFRYLNPKYEKGMFDVELADKWIPVDMYVGGAEHATMHLLYARFIHKFLRDIGLTKADEPFMTLVHQGTITNQGAKMSKSKGNVVNPDDFIEKYGSDVFRMYLMFMGPYDQGGDWSDKGIVGVDRFINKLYEIYLDNKEILRKTKFLEKYDLESLSEIEKNIYKKLHKTIDKVEREIDRFGFNLAIAALMELTNELWKYLKECRDELKAHILANLAFCIAPVAPHFAEECYQIIGGEYSIFEKPCYPKADPKALEEETVEIAIQVNGKLRASIVMPIGAEESLVKETAKSDPRVSRHIEGKTIVKEIYVKNKILNIVVK